MSWRKEQFLRRRRDKSDFSCMIRAARIKTNLTQMEVKAKTGIPQSKLSNYENDIQLPTERNLQKLLNLYNISNEEQQIIERAWSEEMRYIVNTAK